MKRYILLEKSEVTTQMINRSVSTNIEKLFTYKAESALKDYFLKETEFCVVEFNLEDAKHTDCFDSYLWYTSKEVKAIIRLNV